MRIMMNMRLFNQYRSVLGRKTAEKIVYLHQVNEMLTRQVRPGSECACSFESFFNNEEANYERGGFDEYLALLSMSVMIDETLCYVLVDTRNNPESLGEEAVYEEYREYFNFLRIWYHCTAKHVSPAFVLKKFQHPENEAEITVSNKKIRQAKEILWDSGVKMYLTERGREDIAELCEKEFLRDLTIRERYTEKDEARLKPIFEAV